MSSKNKPRNRHTATKYKGVFKLPEGKFQIRVRVKNPKTGKYVGAERIVDAATAEIASQMRHDIAQSLLKPAKCESGLTLTDCAKLWLKRGVADGETEATLEKKTDILNLHVLPLLGDYFVNKIEKGDLRDWVRWASGRKYSPTERVTRYYAEDTVAGWWRTLQALMNWADEEYELDNNPAPRFDATKYFSRNLRKRVQLIEGPNSLTPEELTKFLEVLRSDFKHWYAMGVWGFFCGMRWCELSALDLTKHFDTDAMEVVLRVTQVRGKPVERTKTGVIRRVPYNEFMWDVLQAHRRDLIRRQAPGVGKGLAFPSRTGGYRYPSAFPFGKVCDTAEIPKRLSSKAFRRTWEDLMRTARVDSIVKRSIIGHRDDRMSERYGTVHPTERQKALATILQLVEHEND